MRRVLVAVAVVMSVLVITAPVAADHTITVATQTTDSDFGAGTVTNSEVVRSGTAGSVSHDQHASSALARYALDNGSGTTAYDHAGSNDGSISGATWTSGVRGSGLSFTPTDTVDTGIQTNFQSSFTVSAFVRITNRSATSSRIISDDDNGNGWALTYGDAGVGTLRFFIRGMDTTSLNTGDVISENTWHHVTAIYDAETNTRWIMVDGNVVASLQSDTGTPKTDAGPIRLGAADNNQGINGVIDEARVFGESLTPAEGARLADAPATKQSPTAAERWGMDAGQGATLFGDDGRDGPATEWMSGVSGTAAFYNGSTSSTLGNSGATFETGYTASVWVNPSNLSNGDVIFENYGRPFRIEYGRGGDAKIFTTVRINGSAYSVESTPGSTPVDAWTHVTVRANPGGNLSLFLNGTLASETNLPAGTIENSTAELYFGQGFKNYEGRIDEVRLYTDQLSDAEIQHLYQHPSAQLPETSSYQSPSASVTDPTEVEIDTSQLNATANATVIADGGQTLGSASISSSGTTTIPLSGSASGAHVEVDFSTSDPDHYARVNEVRYRADTARPVINNSSLAPNSTSETIDTQPTLEATFSDADESTQKGDSYTAEWYVDGSLVETTNPTSDGTISTTVQNVSAGEHSWHVEITDEYGHTQTSATAEFTTPSTLKIYEETNPNQLINETNTTFTIRFYTLSDTGGSETVFTRTLTNGSLNMTGLPIDERFIVTVSDEASNYLYRRIVVDSLLETQRIYLLKESEEHSEIIFELEDPAGQFPPEQTLLYVEKPINISGSTTYQTIAGDTFGSTGSFPVYLQQNARYRLRVETVDGDNERILGSYSVSSPTREPLQIQRIEPRGDQTSGDALYGSLDTYNGSDSVVVRYQDPGNESDEVVYRVLNSSGGVVVSNVTSTSDKFAHVYPVTVNKSVTTSYTVEYWLKKDGQVVSSDQFTVGAVNAVTARFDIDPQVLSIISWGFILATMGLLVIINPDLAPIGGTAMASGLVIIGAVGIPPTILGMAGVVSVLTLFGGDGGGAT